MEQIKKVTDCEIVNKIKYLGVVLTGKNIYSKTISKIYGIE